MDNNSRIAKNTIFLYLRMGISMLVSLYTSRVILNALGVEDFGIWGVVGGIVSMFLFLNSALSSTTFRFFAYAIGEGDEKEVNKLFNASFLIHVILAIVIVILCETVGLWFLTHKMVIPEEKMHMAHIVFQFSIVISAISILMVPVTSLIIAYEKMNVFAYLTISDTIFKLLIAWLILWLPTGRLGYYAFFLFLVSLLNALFYVVYCRLTFKNIRYTLVFDKKVYRSLTAFTSWSLFGNLAYVGYTQGLNILLNIFFGPSVNAARTIALQVEQTIRTFVVNFQTAVNPQIIKSYAQNDYSYMHSLIYASSKFSFYLLFLSSLPIMLETEIILQIWLKTVPEYTVSFIRIMLLVIMMETMSNSIMTSVVATGDIKKYHVVVGTLLMLILPVSYVALKLGFSPVSVFYVYLVIEVFACVTRLMIVRPMVKLSIWGYLKNVVFQSARVAVLGSVLPLVVYYFMDASFVRLIVVTLVSLISASASIYMIGLNTVEKRFVLSKISSLIKR